MSKIEELIKEYCPNGVKYIPLNKMAEIGTGKSDRKDASEEGIYPFYVRSRDVLKINKYEYDEKAIIIPGEGGIGEIFHLADGKYALHQRAYRIHVIDELLMTEYLYYYMSANFKKFIMAKAVSATVTSIRKPMIEQFPVPVPPLEVQSEIVHVLDSFTLLTAELTAELTARRKQYEHYRDELLSFDKIGGVSKVRLADIAIDMYRGSGIKKDEVTQEGIPCVRYGEIYTKYNTWFDKCFSHTSADVVSNPKYFEHGDLLFAITGESVEDIAKCVAYVGNEKCMAGGDIVVLKHEQNPKYLSHVLATSFAREQKSKGKVKSKVVHASVSDIGEITIPLPSLEVQERYANVLDNFEEICNDLSIGLPAEIEARKHQYEYYRDMLLSFAETGEIIARQTDRQTDRTLLG